MDAYFNLIRAHNDTKYFTTNRALAPDFREFESS